MGSKNRIAKYLLPIILSNIKLNQWYIEPFCGGCNMIDKVRHPLRIGSDNNTYLIALFKALQEGWTPKEYYTKEEYKAVRKDKENYPNHLVGYLGFVCSFSGKWFGGYVDNQLLWQDGKLHDRQDSNKRALLYQYTQLTNVRFHNKEYDKLYYPPNSVIYCDPPYEDTTGYKDGFNHVHFWQWCRDMSNKGHTVFISEYNAPPDFECVYEHEIKDFFSTHNLILKVEKLFTYGHIEPTWNIQLKLF